MKNEQMYSNYYDITKFTPFHVGHYQVKYGTKNINVYWNGEYWQWYEGMNKLGIIFRKGKFRGLKHNPKVSK